MKATMLKLTLLRHAKSSWDYPWLEDFLRPLNARGYRQVVNLTDDFPEDVDEIWCSPAVRAYTSIQGVLRDKPELELKLKDAIYEASARALIEMLKDGGTLKHIVLVGHNPGLEELACQLTDSEVRMKTAHAALLELECGNWSELRAGTARLIRLYRPEI
ncbi:histidine phosphatase family protein [Vibrio sp. JC009]|uniref:SixA phosphatase family protein n=1 Tax=Vibrio sp. JC009 TaxID=2912314 RepID=UPI0023B1E223|nr:histidine phosphatase family protein [Vibrio sp. JC009]WED23858.1 histidine phosphatase family protein [Vibrio sp. JC009]